MTEHDGSTAPFLDVPVHLLLHFLALEFNIRPVEVFCVNPSHGLVVDVHVIEEEKVRCSYRPTQQF